jgi:hypothetical protein
VIIARSATRSLSLSTLSLYAAFLPSLLGASSAQASPGVPAIIFNVTARVGVTGQFSGPQQTVQARVLVRGNAARIETSNGGTPAVVLFSPPYVYRLLPQSKAGVRWKVDPTRSSAISKFDPQALLRDPSKLKGELMQGGAKKTGSGTIDKAPVDIYEARDFGHKGQTVKVWLRHQDSLPLRLESSGGQIKIVASWRNYQRPQNLSAALFSAPKNFRVREVSGPPPFSAL